MLPLVCTLEQATLVVSARCLKLFLIILCEYFSCKYVCLMPMEIRRGCGIPGIRVMGGCKLSHGCWSSELRASCFRSYSKHFTETSPEPSARCSNLALFVCIVFCEKSSPFPENLSLQPLPSSTCLSIPIGPITHSLAPGTGRVSTSLGRKDLPRSFLIRV